MFIFVQMPAQLAIFSFEMAPSSLCATIQNLQRFANQQASKPVLEMTNPKTNVYICSDACMYGHQFSSYTGN